MKRAELSDRALNVFRTIVQIFIETGSEGTLSQVAVEAGVTDKQARITIDALIRKHVLGDTYNGYWYLGDDQVRIYAPDLVNAYLKQEAYMREERVDGGRG